MIKRPIYIDIPEIVRQAMGDDIYKLCEIYNVATKDENGYVALIDIFKELSEKIYKNN